MSREFDSSLELLAAVAEHLAGFEPRTYASARRVQIGELFKIKYHPGKGGLVLEIEAQEFRSAEQLFEHEDLRRVLLQSFARFGMFEWKVRNQKPKD